MAISGNELKTKPRESKLIQLRPLVVGAVLVFLGFFIGLGLENPMVPTSTQSYSRVIEHPTRQSESNSEMQATNPLLWSASYHLWKSGISETDLSFYRHLKEGTVNPSSGLTAPSCTTISRVNLIRLEENEQNPDQTEFPLRKVSPKILHQPDLKKVIACNLQYPKEVFTQLSNRR